MVLDDGEELWHTIVKSRNIIEKRRASDTTEEVAAPARLFYVNVSSWEALLFLLALEPFFPVFAVGIE